MDDAKIKEGIVFGSDIKELIDAVNLMNSYKWCLVTIVDDMTDFTDVLENFLANNKVLQTTISWLIKTRQDAFKHSVDEVQYMSLKIVMLHSPLDISTSNLGDCSGEHCKVKISTMQFIMKMKKNDTITVSIPVCWLANVEY